LGNSDENEDEIIPSRSSTSFVTNFITDVSMTPNVNSLIERTKFNSHVNISMCQEWYHVGCYAVWLF
jgi:hypothetical protein